MHDAELLPAPFATDLPSQRRRAPLAVKVATAGGAALALLFAAGRAHAQIHNPGDHPHYSVELEPHGLWDWGFGPDYVGTDGFGLGARATIPIIQDGPIGSINNSMGIGFGLDWAHYSNTCYGGYYLPGFPHNPTYYPDCSANSLIFPVVMQWNFWLTPVISVFGEPGFAIEHWWVDFSYPALPGYPAGYCPPGYCSLDSTTVIPVIQGGARFMFGKTVGLTVRVGVPYFSVGASFLL
jgi:hypothetical protein